MNLRIRFLLILFNLLAVSFPAMGQQNPVAVQGPDRGRTA